MNTCKKCEFFNNIHDVKWNIWSTRCTRYPPVRIITGIMLSSEIDVKPLQLKTNYPPVQPTMKSCGEFKNRKITR